jgi:hypothetical protein
VCECVRGGLGRCLTETLRRLLARACRVCLRLGHASSRTACFKTPTLTGVPDWQVCEAYTTHTTRNAYWYVMRICAWSCVFVRGCMHVGRRYQLVFAGRKFPAASLSMCVATLELDMLLRHHHMDALANPFRCNIR